jgi:hypothetical protein
MKVHHLNCCTMNMPTGICVRDLGDDATTATTKFTAAVLDRGAPGS